MLHHSSARPLVLVFTVTLFVQSALSNRITNSYLPPRRHNNIIEVGTPAIYIPPANRRPAVLLPALIPLYEIPPLPNVPLPPPSFVSITAVQPTPSEERQPIPAVDEIQPIPDVDIIQPIQNVDVPKDCNQPCPFNYAPVCGSDGITYTNECTFNVAACKNSNLKIEYENSCETSIPLGTPALPVPAHSPNPVAPAVDAAPPVRIPFPDENPGFQSLPGSGVIPFPSTSFGSPVDSEPLPPISTDSLCNEACTKIFTPVCGTDGVTYNNNCLLDASACKSALNGITIDLAFDGPCETPGNPTNAFMTNEGSIVALEHTSVFEACDMPCTKIFIPVCGTDGFTYNNQCLLDVAACEYDLTGKDPLSLAYEGACVPSNTALFVSAMAPNAAAPLDTFEGSFVSSSSQSNCPEECTKIFTPVCGSDDNTYNNECLLDVAACRSRSVGNAAVLFKAFDGPCVAALPRGPQCDPACDKTYLPVCGTDGETYNNICLLNLADCMTPFITITQAHDGPCMAEISPAGLSSDRRPEISTDFHDPNVQLGELVGQEYIPPV